MPQKSIEAKRYQSAKIRLRLIDIIFVVVYLALFQIIISNPLKTFTYSVTPNFYYAFTIYLIAFSITHYILSFPLYFYSSFILEHKFNLSNQHFFAWLKDGIKSGLLSFAMFLLFVHVLYLFLQNFATTWWAWMAISWFGITVILAKVTPVLIIPLFFKYSPVEAKLKNRIIELSKACGVRLLDVYKIDLSKKTKKLNAAVVGLGRTRRVILADTLVEEFTTDEIVGVLAHEFGHHKLRHMWKLITFGIISIFFSFYVLYLVSSKLVILLGAKNIHDIKMFPAFMLVLFLTGFLLGPLQNAFSRKLERKADLFALEVTQNPIAFISLMKKLASKNLADPNPSKFVKFMFYDHPPISERIKLAENKE
ncbi:MAG: M48 family metallopeptidase [Candidatus Omnitrophica bacterium]|nr:M48 family metallopeptidase [Candidatus Omnitrophota bacterium]